MVLILQQDSFNSGAVNHVHEVGVSKIKKGGDMGDSSKGAGAPQQWLVVAMLDVSLMLAELPIF